jgi:hypothetical protein
MRSGGNFIAYSGGLRPSRDSSGIRINAAQPYTYRRPSASEPILFSLLRDQTLFGRSPPSSLCYPQRGTKGQTNTSATQYSRSMQICETFPRPTRFQRHDQTRSLPRRQRRSPRPRRCTTSTSQHHSRRSRKPTSSLSGHPTILNFLHLASDGRRDGSTPGQTHFLPSSSSGSSCP